MRLKMLWLSMQEEGWATLKVCIAAIFYLILLMKYVDVDVDCKYAAFNETPHIV